MPFSSASEFIHLHLAQQLEGLFFRRTMGSDAKIKFISGNISGLTGIPINNLLALSDLIFTEWIHPDDKKGYQTYQENLTIESSGKFEYRIINNKNEHIWVREFTVLIPATPQKPAYQEGFIKDITFEKENTLLNNAFKSYQSALNKGSIVSITDLKGHILFVNDLFCKHSGYQRQELLGKTHSILHSGFHGKAFYENMWKTILSGKIWQGEIKNKAKDGSFYWVDLIISPVFGEHGELDQFLAIHHPITERKNLERRINDVSKSSSSVIFQIKYANNKYVFNFLSQSAKQIFQLTPEQLYNDFSSFEKQVHSPDLSKFKTSLETSRIEQKEWIHRFRFNTDQKQCWISVRAIPETLENGITLWNGIMTDITLLKETEEEFNAVSTQLSHIFEIQNDCFWGSDIIHKKMLYASPGSMAIYGVTQSEFLNNPNLWFELIVPEDQKKFGPLYAKLGHGETVQVEFRIDHSVTGVKWLECRMTGTLDENGHLVRIDGITSDINERKRIESELRRRERMLSESQRISQIGSWEYIISNETVTYSDEIKRVFGFDSSATPSFKELLKRIEPNDFEKLKAEFINCLHSGSSFRMEHRLIMPDGKIKVVEEQCETEFDAEGKPYRAVGTTRDVTAYVDIADKMQHLINELTAKNEELDRIVYSTSHDLRAPLLSVLGLLDILEENFAEHSENMEIASYIRKSIKRSDDTIKGIVEYSRNSRMAPVYELTNMPSLIEKCLDDIRFMDHAKDITFSTEFNVKSKFASDTERMQTVVHNLITNAVKYQRVENPTKRIKITFTTSRNQGILTVEDNGEGIPIDRQEEVFGMFVRNSVLSVGSGLGLYLCKEIVAKLNGTIKLKSQPGKGSTFTVTIPNQIKLIN